MKLLNENQLLDPEYEPVYKDEAKGIYINKVNHNSD